MLPEELMQVAKANNDLYLKAYETGYLQGWKDALDKALKIMDLPFTVPAVKGDES